MQKLDRRVLQIKAYPNAFPIRNSGVGSASLVMEIFGSWFYPRLNDLSQGTARDWGGPLQAELTPVPAVRPLGTAHDGAVPAGR